MRVYDVKYDSEGRFGSMLKQRRSSLTAKFMFGLGIILLGVISALSLLTYSYLKKIYIREAYEKTDIVLGHIDATMEYARDELRPQVFHALPGNIFIQQVMSSTFMNMGIMSRFKQRFPHYIYRRVALDPMNPANRADPFEESFIKQFRSDPASKQQWRGLVSRNGEDYFLTLKRLSRKKSVCSVTEILLLLRYPLTSITERCMPATGK